MFQRYIRFLNGKPIYACESEGKDQYQKDKFELIGRWMIFKVLGRIKERAVWSSRLRNTAEGAEPTLEGLASEEGGKPVECSVMEPKERDVSEEEGSG